MIPRLWDLNYDKYHKWRWEWIRKTDPHWPYLWDLHIHAGPLCLVLVGYSKDGPP